jgi:hypothetical protein
MAPSIVTGTIVLLLLLVATVSNAYAGGPRYDGPETSDPEVGQCWIDGFDAGATDDYSEDRADECGEDGSLYEGKNQYDRAFDIGQRCLDPELYNYINEDCDAAKDS